MDIFRAYKKKRKRIISLLLVSIIALTMCISEIPINNFFMETVEAATRSNAKSWMDQKKGKSATLGGTQCVAVFNEYLRDVFGLNWTTYARVSYAKQIYDCNLPGFTKIAGNSSFEVGDIVIWNGNVGNGAGHVAIVYSVDGNGVYILDQNWVALKNKCSIRQISSTGSIRGVLRPSFEGENISYDPMGCLDRISGSTKRVDLSGWAFDRDDVNRALTISVSIGGEIHTITANQERTDVNAAYPGVGNYHGFNDIITTSKTGTQTVEVRALNIGGGTDIRLWSGTVTIAEPVRSNYYGDIDGNQEITATDLSCLNQMVYGSMNYTEDQKKRADLNGDGRIDSSDLSLLQQYFFEEIKEFPVERQLASIEIIALPDKMIYDVGESLNTNGLKVKASYNNGNIKEVTGYKISGNAQSSGKQAVTISYTEGQITKTTSYNIYVLEKKTEEQQVVKEDHVYQVFEVGKSWNEAKTYCESLGGHLVTITSQEEQYKINELLKSAGRNSYWIGGYRDSNTWKWITGEKFEYTNWAPNQPDNPKEDSLMVYRNQNPYASSSLGLWNDLYHDGTCGNETFFGLNNFGFICEWEKKSDVKQPVSQITIAYDANGGTSAPEAVTIDGNVSFTISAKKPVKKYRITYKANGGTISKTYKDVEASFLYWNTKSDGTGKNYKPNAKILVSTNMTLYAIYKNVTVGSVLTPRRNGYKFDGWYNGSKKVTSNTILKSNLTLTAKWIKNSKSVKLTYNANGGSPIPAGIQASENSTVKITNVKPTKTYSVIFNANGGEISQRTRKIAASLECWNTKKDGSGKKYYSGSNFKLTSNITLYAIYSSAKLGGLETPKKTGYSFAGWYLDGKKVTEQTKINKNVVLEARWSRWQLIY